MDTTSLDRPAPVAAARSPRALWAVIGVLCVAVAALGGVLIHRQADPAAQAPASAPLAAVAPVRAPDDGAPPPALAQPSVAPAPSASAAIPPPVRAPEVIAQNTAAQSAPAPVHGAAPAPAPSPKACAVCGHVESVRPVQRQKPTTGVGAVAGGVVGGVLGHQIGSGRGRTLATVAGAVGGGFAGNEVEKRTHTETLYQVRVRMDNGSLRTVETRTAPPVGKAVTLKGGVLRPADGRP